MYHAYTMFVVLHEQVEFGDNNSRQVAASKHQRGSCGLQGGGCVWWAGHHLDQGAPSDP